MDLASPLERCSYHLSPCNLYGRFAVKTTYIYGIRDLEVGKYIYVGKSNEPMSRFNGHLQHSHNDCVQGFVEEKGQDNFQVEVLGRVKFKVSEDWKEQEKFWIKKFREEGHPLCNKNDGGGGVTEMSEEDRAKRSKALSGENHPNWGKHRSRETRVKIGVSLLGKKNPNYGKDHSGENGPMFGKHQTEEARAAVARANAKPYPAFYNAKTGQFIPAGQNLRKLCRDQNLNHWPLWSLTRCITEQSRDGWRLATTCGIEMQAHGRPG